MFAPSLSLINAEHPLQRKLESETIILQIGEYYRILSGPVIWIHVKEQQTRKIQQFHPEIEDGFRSEEIAPKVL